MLRRDRRQEASNLPKQSTGSNSFTLISDARCLEQLVHRIMPCCLTAAGSFSSVLLWRIAPHPPGWGGGAVVIASLPNRKSNSRHNYAVIPYISQESRACVWHLINVKGSHRFVRSFYPTLFLAWLILNVWKMLDHAIDRPIILFLQ